MGDKSEEERVPLLRAKLDLDNNNRLPKTTGCKFLASYIYRFSANEHYRTIRCGSYFLSLPMSVTGFAIVIHNNTWSAKRLRISTHCILHSFRNIHHSLARKNVSHE